jgi:hypothetical protein
MHRVAVMCGMTCEYMTKYTKIVWLWLLFYCKRWLHRFNDKYHVHHCYHEQCSNLNIWHVQSRTTDKRCRNQSIHISPSGGLDKYMDWPDKKFWKSLLTFILTFPETYHLQLYFVITVKWLVLLHWWCYMDIWGNWHC